MDKVKEILAQLKKHYFWVLIGVVVVVPVAVWFLATADLRSRFTARQEAIKKRFDELQAIVSNSQHPNDKTIAYVRGLLGSSDLPETLKGKVFTAWELLYREQKEKNQLPATLGEGFKSEFESLGPNKKDLPAEFLELYQSFIDRHLPTLREIVRWRHPKDESGAGGVGPGGRTTTARPPSPFSRPTGEAGGNVETVEMVGVVDWDPASWERIMAHFNWSVRPTTQQVVLAQEDLWVYEALLRVIARTNEGATDQHQAAVKRIANLNIGKDAAAAFLAAATGGSGGTEAAASPSAVAMPGGDVSGPIATPGGTVATPSGTAGAAADTTALETALLNYRYVDDKGVPLAADASPPYAEFKMMPIQMELVVDQRKIARLLVECANSSMPIQILSVRTRPGEGKPLNLAAAGEAAGATGAPGGEGAIAPAGHGGGLGGFGGFGGFGTGSRFGEEGGGSSGATTDPTDPTVYWDIPIELKGIIYIYNPPDKSKLGTGSAGRESEPAPDKPESPAQGGPATPSDAPAAVPPAEPAPPAAPAATPNNGGAPEPSGTPGTTGPAAPPAAPPSPNAVRSMRSAAGVG